MGQTLESTSPVKVSKEKSLPRCKERRSTDSSNTSNILSKGNLSNFRTSDLGIIWVVTKSCSSTDLPDGSIRGRGKNGLQALPKLESSFYLGVLNVRILPPITKPLEPFKIDAVSLKLSYRIPLPWLFFVAQIQPHSLVLLFVWSMIQLQSLAVKPALILFLSMWARDPLWNCMLVNSRFLQFTCQ